ncbi:MAG: 16S rRNA (adenine(1518)-N(6)/adenine(1519)-N(6))-dimethyltransferase RsmA [Clostridiales bacterium]|nr:16S rRNA (adenine(1518)-N(6)/adenine(1519)-N(6))-dimethyltransferase RsmA [Clostridiales bacterium]
MSSKKQSVKSKKKKHNNSYRGRKPDNLGALRPAKSLGQNFLIDEDVIDAIIDGSGVTDSSLVIEIGPGTGALTLPLAERAGKLIAVELDERMIEGLRIKTFGMDNVEIIHNDILKVDLKELISRELDENGLSDVRIVGNLPYYITTPIIMKLLSADTGASSITVMMQKEVGDRIAAQPGTKLSGAITYSVHYYAEVTEIAEAGRECFYPVPKVDSVVLRLDIRPEKAVKVRDEELFFKCIKAGFSQRRKTLHNSLMSMGDVDKKTIAEALARAGIAGERRAESLSMEEFAVLADCLMEA